MTKTIQRPGPYDPCYCPLGKRGNKYKFCHYPMDIAPSEKRRELSQKAYIKGWEVNADHFRSQGCYAWMSSILAKHSPQRILDIGCGNGDGILAMKTACQDAKIVSCDDNAACLESAWNKIERLGFSAEITHRLRQCDAGVEYHKMCADRGLLKAPKADADFALIQADIIWDVEFHEFLCSQPKFDAIAVWLMGTYDLKPECKNLEGRQPEKEYRERVQKQVYELADKILQPQGVLQIVDRFRYESSFDVQQKFKEAHSGQASSTSLKLTDCQLRNYSEPSGANTTPMIKTDGEERHSLENESLGMISIISAKH